MAGSSCRQQTAKLVPKNFGLIDRLNGDLAREYEAIIAYVVYSQVLKGAEYMTIAAELAKHASEELDHAMRISKHIEMLRADPQNESLQEYVIAEDISEILRQEQEHLIDLATALGENPPTSGLRGLFEEIANGRGKRSHAEVQRVRGEQPRDALPVHARIARAPTAARMFAAILEGHASIGLLNAGLGHSMTRCNLNANDAADEVRVEFHLQISALWLIDRLERIADAWDVRQRAPEREKESRTIRS